MKLKKIFSEIQKNKKLLTILSLFAVIVIPAIILISPVQAQAAIECGVGCQLRWFLSELFALGIQFLGSLITTLVGILIEIGKYNSFTTSDAVTKGWVVLRDISNMFFVLILLLISFGTILRLEQYQLKNLLPKVVLMAILVNFSKLISGLIIEASQVVMLTFVSAYYVAGAGNFLDALGLNNINTIDSAGNTLGSSTASESSKLDLARLLPAFIAAFIFSLISLVVIAAFVVIFVIRIVVLWILIVFSPLAFVLSAVPGGQRYSSMWWSYFGKYVVLGPVLAFFLWLSLSSLPVIKNNISEDFFGTYTSIESSTSFIGGAITGTNNPAAPDAISRRIPPAVVTEAGRPTNMLGFFISSVMLIISLYFAQQIGGAVGKVAGGAVGKIQAGGKWALNRPFRGARNVGLAIASSDRVKLADRLGNAASYRVPILGTRIPFVSKSLEGAYMGIKNYEDKSREEIVKKAGKIDNLNLRSAYINGRTLSRDDQILKTELQRTTPSQINNATDRQKQFNTLTEKDFKDMTINEHIRLARLIQGGALRPTAALSNYLVQGGSVLQRGAYDAVDRTLKTRAVDPLLQGQALTNTTAAGNWRNGKNDELESQSSIDMTTVSTRYRSALDKPVVDSVKLSETKALINGKYSGDAASFFNSNDYKRNSDKFITPDEHREVIEHESAIERLQVDRPASFASATTDKAIPQKTLKTEEVDEGSFATRNVSGVNKILRGQGENVPIRLGVDFASLGLQANARGALTSDKTLIPKIISQLKSEKNKDGSSKYSDEQLGAIEERLQSTDKMMLLNQGANTGMSARGDIVHENAHDSLDKVNSIDRGKLEEMWKSLGETERQAITDAIQKRWGSAEPLDEKTIMEEYFAEGITNASRYGNKQDVIQLPKEFLDELSGLGVLKKTERQNQDSIYAPVQPTDENEKNNSNEPTNDAAQVFNESSLSGEEVSNIIEDNSEQTISKIKEIIDSSNVKSVASYENGSGSDKTSIYLRDLVYQLKQLTKVLKLSTRESKELESALLEHNTLSDEVEKTGTNNDPLLEMAVGNSTNKLLNLLRTYVERLEGNK